MTTMTTSMYFKLFLASAMLDVGSFFKNFTSNAFKFLKSINDVVYETIVLVFYTAPLALYFFVRALVFATWMNIMEKTKDVGIGRPTPSKFNVGEQVTFINPKTNRPNKGKITVVRPMGRKDMYAITGRKESFFVIEENITAIPEKA